MYRFWITVAAFAALSGGAFGQTAVPPQNYLRDNSFVNWESPHVHPVDMTPDGSKLLVVNTANNSLEVYTPSGGSLKFSKSISVGLDPVSVRARTSSEAWVVNVISDSISIVDLTNGIVQATLQTDDEPADVVFAGSSQELAYVSCAQAKTLMEFSATSPGSPLARVVVAGEQGRALAVDKTGRYVYLAIFESGNGTTVLPGGVSNGFEHDIVRDSRGPYGGVNAPPNNGGSFKPALNAALPAPIPVSIVVKRTLVGGAVQWLDDNLKNWGAFINGAMAQNGTPADRASGWDLIDRDVAIIDTSSNSVSYQGGLMNILMAIGVNPSTNEITVVGTDPANQIRYEPNLQSTFVRVNFGRFKQGSTNTISDLNPHINYATRTLASGTTVKNSIGDPRGIAWNSAGTQAYVTGMGSNNVVIISATGARLGQINVGQGPTGIVLANGFAYVVNKFDGSISVINTSSNAVSATVPLYFDPTPAAIKTGRPLLYNTQITSALGQASCASCHVDARWDRLAWDLGNPAASMATLANVSSNTGNPVTFHPMKGPLLTMSLVDTMQAPVMHWRGDRPALDQFGPSFNTLLGGTAATQTQINLLRNFLATITLVPNPNRNLDNSYPTALPILGVNNAVIRTGNAAAGAADFESSCRSCHPGHTNRSGAYIDNATDFGVGIRNPPTWKNFYKRTGLWFANATGSTAGFGFQQDGTFDSTHNGSRSDNTMAFMMSFNGGYQYEPTGLNSTNWSNFTHAAVGKQVTLSASNPSDTTGLLTQLLDLGDSGEIGMIAKGGIPGNGPVRGWVYLGNGAWQSDHMGEVDYTATIAGYAANGADITFTAVPIESAVRIGIDMDQDGILDADDAQPNVSNVAPLNIALAGAVTSSPALDSNHTAQKAVDGSTIGYFDQNSMLVTTGRANDWLQEDLGTNAQINLIQLFNGNCCSNRLADVSVFVSQVPFISADVNETRAQAGVREYFLNGLQGELVQLPMQTAGRYIRVQLNSRSSPLQLAEVRVVGYAIATLANPGTQNLAAGTSVNLPLKVTNAGTKGFTSVAASNLPPGLSISSSTGTITGTIQATAASVYQTTITASGPGAGSPSVSFIWNIANGATVGTAGKLPSGAVLCSNENGVCTLPVSATASVYYGTASNYAVKQGVSGATTCNNTAFGDPDPWSPKACYAIVTSLPAVATNCALEGSACNLPSRANDVVFYGAAGTYTYRLNVSGALSCSVPSFGADPASGIVKACFVMPMPSSTGSPVGVNLASNFNVYGMVNDGVSPPSGGVDGQGYAYSSTSLGSTVHWSGVPFTLAPAGAPNAVSGGTVALPAGSYSGLNLLATGIGSAQAGQTFVVTYSDGSTGNFVQGLSDWGSAVATFSGESVAVATPYRIVPGGGIQKNHWNIFGYSFFLDQTKTVKSLTLPNNRNVVVFAVALSTTGGGPVVTAVDMTAADNRMAIANNGYPTSGTGNDGWSYSANLLGPAATWAGQTFRLGAGGTKSAAAGTTIALPASSFSSLSFLATGIYGSQTNQVFTVNYTDGSTTTTTQTLSDWGSSQNFPGESVAVTNYYRVSPSGATQNGFWNLYGYSLMLDSSKVVKSFALPNNGNVLVFAVNLTQ